MSFGLAGTLEPDRVYPIVHAERINTRSGQSVQVSIMDSPNSSVKVFRPRRYGAVVSDRNWKPSIPKAWPYFWSTRGRVHDRTRTS